MADIQPAVQTTVSSAAVEIAAADDGRDTLVIQNHGGGVVRVGDSTVTATTGARIAVDGELVLSPAPHNAVYAIREATTDATVLTQALV